jgi:hypothetical protein
MKRLVKLFEEETGLLYPNNQMAFLEWHQDYVKWLELNLVRLLDFNQSNCNCEKSTFENLK